MGLVKTRRLAAMQKQQRAKAGMRLNGVPKIKCGMLGYKKLDSAKQSRRD